jgi:hypothetical protein
VSRRKPPPAERAVCTRDGCSRVVPRSRVDACSSLCELVVTELAEAQRVVTATGDGELWSAVVGLNEALTTYRLSDTRVYRVARSVGISDEGWRAIKQGTQADLPPADKPICDYGESSSFSPGT